MRLDSYHKEFIRGYIAAALWSSSDNEPGYDEERDGYTEPTPLDDSKYGKGALTWGVVKRMRNNCILFINQAILSIDACIDNPDYDLDYSQAGYDFWLTQAGHGAGFWDGDWPPVYGESLTKVSKSIKSMELYIGGDGKIYAC